MLCRCQLLSRICPSLFSGEPDAQTDGAEEAGLLEGRDSVARDDVAMQRPEAERSGMLTEEQIRNLVDSQLQALADLDARLGDEEEESVAGDVGRGGHANGGVAAAAAEANGAPPKPGVGASGHAAPAVESGDSNGSLLRMERDLDAFLASVEAAEGEGAAVPSSLTAGDISLGNTPHGELDEDEMDFGDA